MDNEFKELNFIEKKNLSREELKNYYIKLRKHIYETTDKVNYMNLRKSLHPILHTAIATQRKLRGQKIEIIGDKRTKTERPIVYAVNHIGKFDIEIVAEAIKDHVYIFLGDPEQLYGTLDWLFLNVNGVVPVDVYDAGDRYVSKEVAIRVLKQGGNLLFFSEGIWNLSPNQPVLPCPFGVIEIAIRSNAIIVPVGVEQVNKNFYVNIGQNISIDDYLEEHENLRDLKIAAIRDLRDQKATLRWEIWEKLGVFKRSSIPDDYYDLFIEDRINEWPEFSLEDINNRVFKEKNVVDQNEVFSFMNEIEFHNDNAFLLNKKLR